MKKILEAPILSSELPEAHLVEWNTLSYRIVAPYLRLCCLRSQATRLKEGMNRWFGMWEVFVFVVLLKMQ